MLDDAKKMTPPPFIPNSEPEARDERRTTPRIAARVRVVLRIGPRVLRLFTKNASQSGMALEMPLSAGLDGNECQIFIAHPNKNDENLSFTGRIVSSRGSADRVVFLNPDRGAQQKFLSWLCEVAKTEEKKADRADPFVAGNGFAA